MNKVKEKLLRLFTIIASMFIIIAPSLNGNEGTVEAADLTNQLVNLITTNIASAQPGQTVKFTMNFGNPNVTIHTGDTIHVDFPQSTATAAGITGIPHSGIPIKFDDPSDPADPLNGQVIGTADVTSTGITITFNSKINGRTITSGSVTFSGKVTEQKGTNPDHVNTWPNAGNLPTPSIRVGQTIPTSPTTGVHPGGTPNIVEPTGQVAKSGNINDQNGNADWQVHGVLGNPGITTITDTAKDGQTILPNTIKITFFGQYSDGQWATFNVSYTPQSLEEDGLGSVTTTSNGFTIKVGYAGIESAIISNDISNDQTPMARIVYTITYQTSLSKAEQDENWNNSVQQTNPNGSKTNTATGTIVNRWNGQATGTQPKNSFKLQKVTKDGDKIIGLAGATFSVSGNGVNETATSNGAGIVEVTDLKPGTYTVKEVSAPKGYTINNETLTVTIDNNGETKISANGSDITKAAFVYDTKASSSSSSSSSKKSSSSSLKSLSSSKKVSSSSVKSSSASMGLVSSSSSAKNHRGISSSATLVNSSSSSAAPIVVSSSSKVTPIISSSSSSSELLSSSSTVVNSSRTPIVVPSSSSVSVVPSSSTTTTFPVKSSSSSMNLISSSSSLQGTAPTTGTSTPESTIPVVNSSSATPITNSGVASGLKPVINISSSTPIASTVSETSTATSMMIPQTSSAISETNTNTVQTTGTTGNQETTVASSNSSSKKQATPVVIGNNNQGHGNNSQGTSNRTGAGTDTGQEAGKGQKGLPQTGEASTQTIAILGLAVLVVVTGTALVYKKH